jgi:hypothetical protein
LTLEESAAVHLDTLQEGLKWEKERKSLIVRARLGKGKEASTQWD